MADKDMSDVKWRDFYDSKRNRGWQGRLDSKLGNIGDGFKKERREGDDIVYIFLGREYRMPADAPVNKVFAYVHYADQVYDDGGTPSPYETPTKDGWE